MIQSPDGRHEAELRYVGEIRFGPPYHSLCVDGISMGGRVFGDAVLWSPDSRYLAVQEWLTTDEAEGPITTLCVVDVVERRTCRLSRADGGFVEPQSFEGGAITYVASYMGDFEVREFEMDLEQVRSWRPLEGADV